MATIGLMEALMKSIDETINQRILESLEDERGKFTSANESIMKDAIEVLVKEGVYPSEPTGAMKKFGYTILDMVKSYGAYWYTYDEPFNCQYCGANLKDEENGVPFKREIAINDFFCDGTIDCICPDCYRSLNNGKQYNKEEFEKANNSPPIETKGETI